MFQNSVSYLKLPILLVYKRAKTSKRKIRKKTKVNSVSFLLAGTKVVLARVITVNNTAPVAGSRAVLPICPRTISQLRSTIRGMEEVTVAVTNRAEVDRIGGVAVKTDPFDGWSINTVSSHNHR